MFRKSGLAMEASFSSLPNPVLLGGHLEIAAHLSCDAYSLYLPLRFNHSSQIILPSSDPAVQAQIAMPTLFRSSHSSSAGTYFIVSSTSSKATISASPLSYLYRGTSALVMIRSSSHF